MSEYDKVKIRQLERENASLKAQLADKPKEEPKESKKKKK